jgi:hypothetical protein
MVGYPLSHSINNSTGELLIDEVAASTPSDEAANPVSRLLPDEDFLVGLLLPPSAEVNLPAINCLCNNAMDEGINSPKPFPPGEFPKKEQTTGSFLFDDVLVLQDFLDIIQNAPLDYEQEGGGGAPSNDVPARVRNMMISSSSFSSFEKHFVAPFGQQHEDLGHSEVKFPAKLFRMLEDAERDGNNHIVSWILGGTAFQVHDTSLFFTHIMPNYFDMSKYASFRRQISLYGFKKCTIKTGTYFQHQYFVQKDPLLCQEQMLRTETPAERRRRSNTIAAAAAAKQILHILVS